jgi:hypothetical protein
MKAVSAQGGSAPIALLTVEVGLGAIIGGDVSLVGGRAKISDIEAC